MNSLNLDWVISVDDHILERAEQVLDKRRFWVMKGYGILRGNAERLYHFTPAEPPALSRQ